VNIIYEPRRGLPLPHKGDLIPLDDRVSVFGCEFEKVCVHVPIVIDLRDAL
jgi:hypothetical protein